ncbi:formate/nitrite transporter family protein [Clostridium cylindrosporum]|uniref:Formate/nitrite family of transporter n=1 Tax=Clostridium cylindrosporum DSM 605 TaxID=1121307 RepID=A0A0J8G661_CLOCY|nr:formate/nitrite transporter family protein [Clostridium cylindrosporum]KMT23106.1 formate/nitrite family of transporter [Clostridium cylindrosporum DSM 605]
MEKGMLTTPEICQETIQIGIKKGVKTMFYQTLILATLAGAFIAFGSFVSMVGSHGISNYGLSKFVAGALFPVGLVLVLVCGAELFTGNTLLIQAYMEKEITLFQFVKNLVTVYVGNFIGAFMIAVLIYLSGLLLGNDVKLGAYVIKVAAYKGSLTFMNALASGILCNFLVCLAVWGSYAAKDVAGKILIVWVTIMTFITSGFEHSVANMYYFSIGILAKLDPRILASSHLPVDKINSVNIWNAIGNIIPVTIGNIIGGMLLVGLAYWFVFVRIPKNQDGIKKSKEDVCESENDKIRA